MLAYKRFHGLRGLGGYIREAYKLEGITTGGPGKPPDQESDYADSTRSWSGMLAVSDAWFTPVMLATNALAPRAPGQLSTKQKGTRLGMMVTIWDIR